MCKTPGAPIRSRAVTGVGQRGDGVAAVVGIRGAGHPAALFETFDDVRETRQGAIGQECQLAHADSSVGEFGDVAQGEVIEQCEVNVMVAQFRKWMPDRAPIWTETGVTVLGLPKMRVEIRVTAILGDN
jgi:hypothetical protein